jgi:hypothetical protein
MGSIGWDDENREVDQDLDLFYVLATVLGEDEMIPLDPTSTASSTTNTRRILFRDQPIRDIVDRVTIFRDLEPVQVSTILINLALYVERVHSKLEDTTLLPDIAQLLIKITKYTTEWDQHQLQKQKDLAQQLKYAQERQNSQQQQQQFLNHHLLMRPQTVHRVSDPSALGKTFTMASSASAVPPPTPQQQQQQQQRNHRQQKQKQNETKTDQEQLMPPTEGAVPVAMETTDNEATDQLASVSRPHSLSDEDDEIMEAQRRNTITSVSFSPSTEDLESPQHGQLSNVPSSVTSESHLPQSSTGTSKPPPLERRKSPCNVRASFDLESSGTLTKMKNNRHDSTYGGSQASTSTHQRQPNKPLGPQKRPLSIVQHHQHWTYSNAVLNMCSSLIIENPMRGHHLMTAVKQVLKQVLYRDKIAAKALIRLATAYCYMAELDFSLPLTNIFGELLVEELRNSMQQSQANGTGSGKHEDSDESDDDRQDHDGEDDEKEKILSPSKRSSKALEKEKDKDYAMGHRISIAGGSGHGPGTKMLASNFHLLHHVRRERWIA